MWKTTGRWLLWAVLCLIALVLVATNWPPTSEGMLWLAIMIGIAAGSNAWSNHVAEAERRHSLVMDKLRDIDRRLGAAEWPPLNN